MRYKIKAPDDSAYRNVLELLEADSEATVHLTSPRRRTVGTGELPDRLRSAVEQLGGEVLPDRQYDLETTRRL